MGESKYDKAVECLIKDREALLAFYDFPAEALEASANDQRHRKLVRDDPPPHGPLQGMSLQQDRARHDLQTCRGRREELAAPRRPQPVAEAHPRCKVRRRNRSRQIASSSCRLTPSVTKIRR